MLGTPQAALACLRGPIGADCARTNKPNMFADFRRFAPIRAAGQVIRELRFRASANGEGVEPAHQEAWEDTEQCSATCRAQSAQGLPNRAASLSTDVPAPTGGVLSCVYFPVDV